MVDVIIKTFFSSLSYKTNRFQAVPSFFFIILEFPIYLTNRFQVAVRLFSYRSQRTSKCGKNISDALGCASCATFLFLPHLTICDLLLKEVLTFHRKLNIVMEFVIILNN